PGSSQLLGRPRRSKPRLSIMHMCKPIFPPAPRTSTSPRNWRSVFRTSSEGSEIKRSRSLGSHGNCRVDCLDDILETGAVSINRVQDQPPQKCYLKDKSPPDCLRAAFGQTSDRAENRRLPLHA